MFLFTDNVIQLLVTLKLVSISKIECVRFFYIFFFDFIFWWGLRGCENIHFFETMKNNNRKTCTELKINFILSTWKMFMPIHCYIHHHWLRYIHRYIHASYRWWISTLACQLSCYKPNVWKSVAFSSTTLKCTYDFQSLGILLFYASELLNDVSSNIMAIVFASDVVISIQ